MMLLLAEGLPDKKLLLGPFLAVAPVHYIHTITILLLLLLLLLHPRTPPDHPPAHHASTSTMAANDKFEGWLGLDKESVKGNMQWGQFEPKKWSEDDVDIEVSCCGICGSDVSLFTMAASLPYQAHIR